MTIRPVNKKIQTKKTMTVTTSHTSQSETEK